MVLSKKLLALALLAGELNTTAAHVFHRQDGYGGAALDIIDNMVGYMTNAVNVFPDMLNLMGQIVTGPPPAEPTPEPPAPTPGPTRPQGRPARIDMSIIRDPAWTGAMTPIPPYTDDYDEINERLQSIGVRITRLDFEEIWEERGLSQELWDRFKGTPGPVFEDFIEAGIYTDNWSDYVARHVLPANRFPQFTPEEVSMGVTLVRINNCSQSEFTTPLCFNPAFANSPPEVRIFAGIEWWAMHSNFWQGDVCAGVVDPSLEPIGVESRFVYPMLWADQVGEVAEKPQYHFFYWGDGMFAKIRIWPGETEGWDVSYPGGWPHGTVPVGIVFSDFVPVLFQAVGINENMIAWYNTDDPNTQATSNQFAAQYAETGIKDPDFMFALNKNPWVDPSMLPNVQTLHLAVLGDDEPACYHGHPSLCTPNRFYPDEPLIIRPAPFVQG